MAISEIVDDANSTLIHARVYLTLFDYMVSLQAWVRKFSLNFLDWIQLLT